MNLHVWSFLAVTGLMLEFVLAIPIDNGVVVASGDPTIQCSSDALTVVFQTQKPFEGRVYVKGFVDQPGCVGMGKGTQAPSLNLTFTTCGVTRARQIMPPGIMVSSTIVISFHKTFVTKVDKAYRVSCFYMEAGKTVSAELEVSMLSTGYVTNAMAMPICKYEILSGGATGTPLKYAKVGDMVYHKWSCESHETMFCMRVHSCNVDDGQGGKPFEVLDAKGCAIDRYVLQNLEYPADLMAGREAHVFKFADKPTLYFNCQLEISVKSPEVKTCDAARPQCPDAGTGAGAAAGISGVEKEKAPGTGAEKGGLEKAGATEKPGGMGGSPGNSPSTAPGKESVTSSSITTTGKPGEGKGEPKAEAKGEGKEKPEAKGEGRSRREARKFHQRNLSDFTIVGDFDLPRQQLLVLDIEESQNREFEDRERSNRTDDDRLRMINDDEINNLLGQKICMSPTFFALSLAAVFIVFVLIVAFSIKAFLLRRSPVKYPKYNR